MNAFDNIQIAEAFSRVKQHSEALAFLEGISQELSSPAAEAAKSAVREALHQEVGRGWRDIFQIMDRVKKNANDQSNVEEEVGQSAQRSVEEEVDLALRVDTDDEADHLKA